MFLLLLVGLIGGKGASIASSRGPLIQRFLNLENVHTTLLRLRIALLKLADVSYHLLLLSRFLGHCEPVLDVVWIVTV